MELWRQGLGVAVLKGRTVLATEFDLCFPLKHAARSPGPLQVPPGCAWLGMWGGGGSAFEMGLSAGLTGRRWMKHTVKCPQGPWTSGQARGPTGLHLVRFPMAGSGYLSQRAERCPQELPSSARFPLWPQIQPWTSLCLCACSEPPLAFLGDPAFLGDQPWFSCASGCLFCFPFTGFQSRQSCFSLLRNFPNTSLGICLPWLFLFLFLIPVCQMSGL